MISHTTTTTEPVPDDLLEALAHRCRRQVVRVLQDHDGVVPLSDLAAEVAHRERAVGDGGPPDPDRIETLLHHVHLPKLADAGLVSYSDTDEGKPVMFTGTPETNDMLSDLVALSEE